MKTNKTCAIIGDINEFEELLPLTARRPVSLLPFDGMYRMIDFNLSNVIDADIHSIYMIFNQGMTQSVIDHISSGKEWDLSSLPNRYFMHFFQGFEDEKLVNGHYYETIIEYIKKSNSEFTVFMGNKMLCNLDLAEVRNIHNIHPEDMTVVYKKMPIDKINKNDILLDIETSGSVSDSSPRSKKGILEDMENLFMNIFIVKSDWLIQELEEGKNTDKTLTIEEVLKDAMKTKRTWAFEYTGYLSNVYDIRSYYDANMDMLESSKFLSLLHSSKKIYMKNINSVPTYYSKDSEVVNSQVAAGCLIYGRINNSIFSSGAYVEENATVYKSIVMAKTEIKRGAHVEYAILDKNVVIEEGVRIVGTKNNPIVIQKNERITENIIQSNTDNIIEDVIKNTDKTIEDLIQTEG